MTTKIESVPEPTPIRSRGGFRHITPERRREIASLGGRIGHEMGVAHEFDSAEARIAGRKGGLVVSDRPGHMAQIGRKGGEKTSSDRDHMAVIGAKGGESVARDREHMAALGRKGAEAVAEKKRERRTPGARKDSGGAGDLAAKGHRPALPTSGGSRGATTAPARPSPVAAEVAPCAAATGAAEGRREQAWLKTRWPHAPGTAVDYTRANGSILRTRTASKPLRGASGEVVIYCVGVTEACRLDRVRLVEAPDAPGGVR